MSAKKLTVKRCKPTSLTNQEIREIIEAVESGGKKKDVAEKFGLPKSTLSTFFEIKEKIYRRSISVVISFKNLTENAKTMNSEKM